MRPELVVRAVNELKCHFFLGMAPDTPQTRRVGSGAPRTRGRGPGHGGGASATGRGLRHGGGASGTREGPRARGRGLRHGGGAPGTGRGPRHGTHASDTGTHASGAAEAGVGSRGPGSCRALAAAHLVLVPPVQVPVQDHTGPLPLPDLQEHSGCSGARRVSRASLGWVRGGAQGAGAGWSRSSGWPPGARSDLPHRAMKMANSTVPSLSKRWVSWGEGAGLGPASPLCAPRPPALRPLAFHPSEDGPAASRAPQPAQSGGDAQGSKP